MKLGFFSKYFPPEKFLKPPHIGISFSDTNIKAVYFDKTQKAPSLTSVEVPIEDGAVVDGVVVNAEEVIKKLSTVKKSFNSPFVFFTIPDELTYVFPASVPMGPGGDMIESVSFIMEENVPLSLSEIIFDFMPTQVVASESEYKVSVVVAACAKKEVEKFIEIIRKSGFEPIGCVHESQAIANAVVPKNSTGTLCIVQAREKRVGIYLIKDNLVHFSTLRSILGEDYKKQFLDEYEKFLEYCLKYNVNREQPIRSILVCGEFDSAKKVVEAVTGSPDKTGDTKLSNVWTNVFDINKHTPDISYEKSLNFAGPVGTVLSDII